MGNDIHICREGRGGGEERRGEERRGEGSGEIRRRKVGYVVGSTLFDSLSRLLSCERMGKGGSF